VLTIELFLGLDLAGQESSAERRVRDHGDAELFTSSDDLLGLLFVGPGADFNLHSGDWIGLSERLTIKQLCGIMKTYSRCTPQCRCANFRDADVVEEALLDEGAHVGESVLKLVGWVHSCVLEEVDLLLASESLVASEDTPPNVLRTVGGDTYE
jgi:hypothetical protein